MKMMKLLLEEMMINAAEDGMPVWDWDPEEVAWEIKAYTDDLAEASIEEMTTLIKEIQDERNPT